MFGKNCLQAIRDQGRDREKHGETREREMTQLFG